MANNFKYTKNLAFWGGLTGFIGNLFVQILEYNDNKQTEHFSLRDFFDSVDGRSLVKTTATGAVIGASAGLIGDLIEADEQAQGKAFPTTAFLSEVLAQNELLSVPSQIQRKIDKISRQLNQYFKSDLAFYPKIQGSVAQGTALKSSDFDIEIVFRNNGRYSIEGMYEAVAEFFEEKFDDSYLVQVRRQSRSLGLFFEIGNSEIRIDVVPKRQIRENDTSTYLCVQQGYFSSPTWTKSDASEHLKTASSTKGEAKVQKLLKVFKETNEFQISSTHLRLLVSEAYAYNKGNVPKTVKGQLIMAMKHIRDRIETARIVDPGNSNNIISDSISDAQKREIANLADNVLSDIKTYPHRLQHYFSVT